MNTVRANESLIVLRHRNHTGLDPRALQRAERRGEMLRLASGAYVSTATWRSLSSDDQRRLQVAAAFERNSAYVASHRSAAALWHIPTIRRHDGVVHARVTAAAGSRSEHGMRKHAVQDLDLHLTTAHGIPCTSLERTVLDLAMTEPFDEAVVAADWVLSRGLTKDRLRDVLEEWSPVRNRLRVEKVIAFADGDAGSPGESVSRVQMADSSLPTPILQGRFDDRAGLIGYVDFWWPEFNLIGEFDGLKKYREASMRGGVDAGEIVAREKTREDRLRATATRPGVTRWIWSTLTTPGGLAAHLAAAGLAHRR